VTDENIDVVRPVVNTWNKNDQPRMMQQLGLMPGAES
jgi:hypothetical protein